MEKNIFDDIKVLRKPIGSDKKRLKMLYSFKKTSRIEMTDKYYPKAHT